MALPMMGSSLAEIAMIVVDGVMCGHIDDHGQSLTALGYTVQIWFILLAPASALAVGTVALVSRAHGAGETDRLNRTVAQSAQVAALIGVLVAVAGITLGPTLLRALGASPTIEALGTRYLRTLMLGVPAMFLYEGCVGAALRSVGNTRLPFVCGIAGNVVNLVLAYALIFGHLGMPRLGIAGAGIATAIASYAGVALLVVASRARAIGGLVLRLRVVGIDREVGRELVRVGLPSLVELLTFYGAMTALIWILARVDETSVAAHAIGARLANLFMVPMSGIAGATAALVGQALGAGSVDRAKAIYRTASRVVLVTATPIAVATFLCAPAIAGVYDVVPGSSLEHLTVQWLHIVAIAMIPQGVMKALEGLLFGAGATRTVMRINLWSNLGLRLVLAIGLGLGTSLGAVGVWVSWPVVLVVQVPLAYIAYRRGRWAVTGVTAPTT
jgi:MATE family multidrug resistance protein